MSIIYCTDCGRAVRQPRYGRYNQCATCRQTHDYDADLAALATAAARPIPRVTKPCADCRAPIIAGKPSELCDACIDERLRALREVVQQGVITDWGFGTPQPYGMATHAPVRWQDMVAGAIAYAEFTLNWPLYGRGRAA